MTRAVGVFPVMCPSGESGVGLAPACWPDQKPVHVVSARPVTVMPPAVSPPDRHRMCPPTLGPEVARMLADQLDYVIGVDPHRDSHALAVMRVVSGAIVFETIVEASSDGYAHALKLVNQHATGRRAFAVEGTGSFGAGLTRFLTRSGEQVLEVGRLRRERRSGGKTDALDAVRAARSVLTQRRPATPRAG